MFHAVLIHQHPIPINTPFVCRDGRKIRLHYHVECFSGSSDPRSQPNSSFSDCRFAGVITNVAPLEKGKGKWSVSKYGISSQSK
jgi:hypothetical protein